MRYIENALTFLVISCPCALVISVPLGFFGGMGGASTRGVLLKGSTGIEALAETRCVVFDKTGTLTRGEFEVIGERRETGVTRERLLELAALAESWSNHPISRSLVEAAGSPDAKSRVTDAHEEQGGGVSAVVDGLHVSGGQPALYGEARHRLHGPRGRGYGGPTSRRRAPTSAAYCWPTRRRPTPRPPSRPSRRWAHIRSC